MCGRIAFPVMSHAVEIFPPAFLCRPSPPFSKAAQSLFQSSIAPSDSRFVFRCRTTTECSSRIQVPPKQQLVHDCTSYYLCIGSQIACDLCHTAARERTGSM